MKQIIEKTIKGFGELPHAGKPNFSVLPAWTVLVLAWTTWVVSEPSQFNAVVVLWVLYVLLLAIYGLACCYGAYHRTLFEEQHERLLQKTNAEPINHLLYIASKPVDEDLDPPVYFDLDRLEKSIQSGTIRVPMGLSRQERREYLHQLAEALKNVDKD